MASRALAIVILNLPRLILKILPPILSVSGLIAEFRSRKFNDRPRNFNLLSLIVAFGALKLGDDATILGDCTVR